MKKWMLDGTDWTLKEFVGLDWVWRDSVMPDTKDVRWWIPAQVPGSVLADVWRAGQVPDPYFELNSKACEWVAARTWVYRKVFRLNDVPEGERAFLHFAGVDYACRVFLNGKEIGRHEGMYTPFSFEVAPLLHIGENLLAVVVERAPDEQPQVGETSAVRTHKSRMTYWWDFCPRLIHQGIWDHVWLEWTGKARLTDVWVSSRTSDDYSEAEVTVSFACENAEGCRVQAEMDGIVCSARVQNGTAVCTLSLKHPRLWHVNGYGEQALYWVRASLFDSEGRLSDETALRHGVRRLEWEKNENAPDDAPSYCLRVNGERVYLKGYNWVPMDVMYGVERPEKLKRLIALAKAAHVNLFRVWGGGLIEKDSFYEACADAGILVWQEFILSSSGIDNTTPRDQGYREMLTEEARRIVRAKRNHTALAIWCGGNELQTEDGMPLDSSDPVLSALRGVVRELDPQRKWLPTSPSGGVFSNTMENIEKCPDRLCDVHGPWEHQGIHSHYELYNRGTCLLHSEFGVEGMTNLRTLMCSVGEEHRLPAGKDNPVYFHRGAWWTNDALIREDFEEPDGLRCMQQASQFMQYEGLKYAVECDRRRAFHCSGTLPWQFNEPYPNCYCTSNVDYYAQPKPAYYGVKRAYEPETATVVVKSPSFWGEQEFSGEIWVAATHLRAGEEVQVRAELFALNGERLLSEELRGRTEEPGKSVCLGRVSFPCGDIPTDLFFLRLDLKQRDGGLLSRNEYLFTTQQTWSCLKNKQPQPLAWTVMENLVEVENRGTETALWVWLQEDAQARSIGSVLFAENYFLLLPGEKKRVSFEKEGDAAFRLHVEQFGGTEIVD